MFEGDELSYYTKETMRDKKGVIPLRKIRAINHQGSYKGKENVFVLSLDARNFYIQAPNDYLTKLWIDAITKMKDFFENQTSSFMLDNAIEVDDPCFDLGEETTVLEEGIPQRQTLSIADVPEWSTTSTSFESGQTEQPVVGSTQSTPMRSTTKFIGVIGKTRSKMFPVSENKLDYFDRDDEDDDESNNNDEEPKELSESSKEDRSAILNDSGDKLKRSITDNTDGDYIPNLQIDIMVKEMKNSIQFFNLAFFRNYGF